MPARRAVMSSVLTDRNDPDNIGFVQWRAAFYCGGAEGCLENFMALLDDFFVWKTKVPLDAIAARAWGSFGN